MKTTKDLTAYPSGEGCTSGFSKLEAVAKDVFARIPLDAVGGTWDEKCQQLASMSFDMAIAFCAEADRRKERK